MFLSDSENLGDNLETSSTYNFRLCIHHYCLQSYFREATRHRGSKNFKSRTATRAEVPPVRAHQYCEPSQTGLEGFEGGGTSLHGFASGLGIRLRFVDMYSSRRRVLFFCIHFLVQGLI